MALIDKSSEIEYPYNIHQVYEKLIFVAKSLEGMTLEKTDDRKYFVQLKCEKTIWSWGETVTVECRYVDDCHTSVFIKSVPKVKTTLVDYGKGKRNIQQIVDALNKELPVVSADSKEKKTHQQKQEPLMTTKQKNQPVSNPHVEVKQESTKVQPAVEPLDFHELSLTTDTDCVLYIGGVKQLQLIEGLAQSVPLKPGKYAMKFVSLENPDECLSLDFEMQGDDAEYEVMFKNTSSNGKTGGTSEGGGGLTEVIRRRQEAKREKLTEEQRKMAEVIRKLGEEAQRQRGE